MGQLLHDAGETDRQGDAAAGASGRVMSRQTAIRKRIEYAEEVKAGMDHY